MERRAQGGIRYTTYSYLRGAELYGRQRPRVERHSVRCSNDICRSSVALELCLRRSRQPGNVLLNGSGSCAVASRTVRTAEALRFDRTVARVDSLSVQGYGNHVRPGIGPSAITFVSFATGYVENLVCTGAGDLDSA